MVRAIPNPATRLAARPRIASGGHGSPTKALPTAYSFPTALMLGFRMRKRILDVLVALVGSVCKMTKFNYRVEQKKWDPSCASSVCKFDCAWAGQFARQQLGWEI